MGQISSRHRPEDPSSPHSALSSTQSSSTRITDDSSPASTQPPSNSRLPLSHHNSDLSHQPLPPKRNPRKSFLGTLRSPLRSRWKPQRTSPNEADVTRASNTHKRWTFDRRRRKTSEPARTLTEYSELAESQLGEPSSRGRLSSAPSPPLSGPAPTDPKGKAKENDPSASISDLPTTPTVGPSSSGSSTTDASQSNVMPLQSTATDISSPSSSAPSSASSSSPPRDLHALNHDPSSIPTAPFQPDDTPGRTRDDSEPFNVMERPATPPDASQAHPLPEARRNFPAAGTLVVVQGVVHTSDASQSAASGPTEPTPRRASSVPPPGERPQRRRFSDLLSRPIRSRRSSYAAPESRFSESNAGADNGNREESSPTSESSQASPTQDEPPVSASRPLSLSPTSIDVLGTLLSVATAATAASLVSGSSEPLLNSGFGLPSSPSVQGSQQQQPTPSPSPMPLLIPDQTPTQNLTQGQNQGQSRPLSPTPTAGLASRDRIRNAWTGLRDRLGFGPSSPTTSPVSPPAISPPPDPEPAPSAPPVIPVDPRTQLLADMARAFQMGMGLEDGSGSGSRSAGPSSPAIEVNLGDGQQRQQQTQQQERPQPTEDSFERFLMDLQADLRRTLEEGQPETEPTPEQEQEVEPVGVAAPPLIYPQDVSLSTDGRQPASGDLDFGGDLPALPPDDDDFPHLDEAAANLPDFGDHRQSEGETVTLSPSVPSSPASQLPQTPTRRTVTGSERRPGGGINWWRMYRFPPMVVPLGTPSTIPSPASPLPPPTTVPPASAADVDAPPGERGPPSPSVDTQAQTQDGNTVVPVIVVGLQSVHGYGLGHGHRHADGRNEHPPQQERQQDAGAGQDSDHTQENDLPAGPSESPRDRERRWSTRAADAFRGLRPAHGAGPTRRDGTGSSSTEGSTRPIDDGHGSTTFFIYVIGGYYPPNHQLVIGTDPLDSFEELAELLGQAKPQTASKEEIDNSGLEVIRVGVLADYEKLGRVAPMCVDRCLICLEEYNVEEDLRLLSCRHVFHKDCVDRWLETGRNNCPACRTQGVSNSGPIPVPSS